MLLQFWKTFKNSFSQKQIVGTIVKPNYLHKQNESKVSFGPGPVGTTADSELVMSHCFLHRFED